jgi:hypothetical protein
VKRLTRSLGILGIAGLVTAGTVFGQSQGDLRRTYGAPLSEVFVVRPGISATATYATDGRIIELMISPRITGPVKSRVATLSRDSVDEVLNELVPASKRGRFIRTWFFDAVCEPENDCAGVSLVFQNVTIYYNSGRGGVCYAIVKWKD